MIQYFFIYIYLPIIAGTYHICVIGKHCLDVVLNRHIVLLKPDFFP